MSWDDILLEKHLSLLKEMMEDSITNPPSFFCRTVASDIEEIKFANASEIFPKYGLQGKKMPSHKFRGEYVREIRYCCHDKTCSFKE